MRDRDTGTFTFRDDSGHEQVLSINHPETGVRRFAEFVQSTVAHEYSVENAQTGERFTIEPGRNLMTRSSGPDSSLTEYLILEGPGLVGSVRMFFQGGCTGLDGLSVRLGPWLGDPAELEFSPERRGAALAHAIATEEEALRALVQRWADRSDIDPSDQCYVFLGGYGIDECRAERAELLGLISFLDLEQIPAQYGGGAGEVWVRFDQRVNREMEKQTGWSPASPPDDKAKQFVLRDDAGHEKTMWLSHAQQGYEAVSDFLKVWPSERYSVEDLRTGARLSVDLTQAMLTRFSRSGSRRTEFLRITASSVHQAAHRAQSAASEFVGGSLDGDALAGLDQLTFGYWVDDLSAPQPSPEEWGTTRAQAIQTEAEAIREVMSIWAVSGHVDYTMNPPNGHYVFFDGHADDDVDDLELRAALEVLIPFLGLERVSGPTGASSGAVWVRADPRLDAVVENYS